MPGPWEEVRGLGLLHVIALLPQSRHVPRQRGGVAGDVDQAGGGHLGDGVHDLRGDALAGRVHADDVRPQAPAGQLLGGFPRVGAEKLRVGHAVAGGVGLGVLDGGGNDLGADGFPGPAGQDQGDGPDAAVEVQDRLRPGELGEV